MFKLIVSVFVTGLGTSSLENLKMGHFRSDSASLPETHPQQADSGRSGCQHGYGHQPCENPNHPVRKRYVFVACNYYLDMLIPKPKNTQQNRDMKIRYHSVVFL